MRINILYFHSGISFSNFISIFQNSRNFLL